MRMYYKCVCTNANKAIYMRNSERDSMAVCKVDNRDSLLMFIEKDHRKKNK